MDDFVPKEKDRKSKYEDYYHEIWNVVVVSAKKLIRNQSFESRDKKLFIIKIWIKFQSFKKIRFHKRRIHRVGKFSRFIFKVYSIIFFIHEKNIKIRVAVI